nr:hypothetical protein [Tanacetum cinerariifolium]
MLNSSTGLFSFQFSSMDGLNSILDNGPWFIRDHLLILRKWDPDVDLMKDDVGNVPVWVKLHVVLVRRLARMAEVELKDTIMVALPKITRDGYYTCNLHDESKWKAPRCKAKTWLDELNESTIKTWDELQIAFISRFFPPALFDRLLREIRAFSRHENESLTDALLCSSYSDTDKIMARMDAMTIKMDAQYKELQSRAKQSIPYLDDDDMPMSREEEVKFIQTFCKTCFYNDYHDRDSNRDNWRSSGWNDYNRDNYRSNTDDKPYDLQKQFNDFMKSQQSTNAFVKENLWTSKLNSKQ